MAAIEDEVIPLDQFSPAGDDPPSAGGGRCGWLAWDSSGQGVVALDAAVEVGNLADRLTVEGRG